LEKKFINRQNLSLCNSSFTRDKILASYCPTHPDRVITLRKAVDLAFFKRPRLVPQDPLCRPVNALKIVFVGSDIIRKGLDLLVQAVCQLPPSLDWHLTIIGATQLQTEQAFPQLKNKLASPHILFAGKLDKEQLRRVLWNSTLFVLPSRAEALGVALLEALAAGLSVVSTQVGGIPEIINDCSIGTLVPPDDISALAAALVATKPQLGNNLPPAVEKILESFSTQAMIASLRNLYLSKV
jgi:starch synthase